VLTEALKDCARRPGFFFWSLFQVAAAALCAAVPITSRPGYESALVLAPVAAAGSGIIAAGTVVRARRLHEHLSFSRLGARVLVAVLPGVVASLLVLIAAASLRGFCDPWQGLAFFAVGPLGSVLAAASLATVLALALPGRRWPYAGFIAALALSLAWDGALIYYTPQVFVFDHLLGSFAGPLYDESVGIEARHLVFRLVTAARTAALVLAAALLHDRRRQRLVSRRLEGRSAQAAIAALVLVGAATFFTEPKLGLRSSQGEIQRRLGGTTATPHFVIHHPAELTGRQVAFLEAEAEIAYGQLEEFFGDAPERRLTLYFFRSGREMRTLTGTGPTNVAKPWLGAAFMVYEPPPHTVLTHETAHLFGAKWGRGPLRTPGALWGLLADPMILEGTAVAADWRGDPLDPHERSAAILRIGLIDDPEVLAGMLGFYTHQGGLAYVMAGSFVRHLWSVHGPEAIRAWYSGASFEEAFSTSRSDAMAGWQERLSTVEVPPRWLAALERLYSRRSVFHRPCPHQVALLLEDAARAHVAGRADRTASIYDRVCRIAPADTGLRLVRLSHLVSSGQAARARSEVNSLLEPTTSSGGHASAIQELSGDVHWLEGGDAQAARSYSRALGLAARDARIRMLSVKIWAVRNPGPGRPLRPLLLGFPGPGKAQDEAVALLAGLVDLHPDEPLLSYLLARAHCNGGQWEQAAPILESCVDGLSDVPVIQGEALRLLAAALLWTGDRAGSLDAIGRLEKMGPPSSALGYHARRWRALAEVMR
jgi:hypothetical protein